MSRRKKRFGNSFRKKCYYLAELGEAFVLMTKMWNDSHPANGFLQKQESEVETVVSSATPTLLPQTTPQPLSNACGPPEPSKWWRINFMSWLLGLESVPVLYHFLPYGVLHYV